MVDNGFECVAGVTGRSSSKSYSVKDETSNEIMAVIKLDNVTVAQTNWKPCSQQAWDQRFSIELDKSREVTLPSAAPRPSSLILAPVARADPARPELMPPASALVLVRLVASGSR